MIEQPFDTTYDANPAANYERYFVPAIGAPMAEDLLRRAALRPGERVLDVACGTGVVARRAAERVGDDGHVAGLDPNPGMLAVARRSAPDASIEWHEASAEAMPLPDASFDAVLCQMGLQFVPDKPAAAREMRRVLAHGGRLLLNLPGPTPLPFAILAEALSQHVSPDAAGFVQHVFSLHDLHEIERLLADAGLRDVSVEAEDRTLRLPPPEAFLWQYISSTPLAARAAQMGDEQRPALERDVVAAWQPFAEADGMRLDVRVVTATARA